MKGVAVVFPGVLAGKPGEAVSCDDVQSSLSPCLPYLTQGGEPSDSCCGSVKGVSGSLQSSQDWQAACNCIKSAASSYNEQPDAARIQPSWEMRRFARR